MTTRTIRINGEQHTVLNAYSQGPGMLAHTYCIAGGEVHLVGDVWTLEMDRGFPVVVAVERPQ